MKVVYFHGFTGNADGGKSKSLKQAFGDHNVISPPMLYDPDVHERVLDSMLKTMIEVETESKTIRYPVIFIGVSLGGFWAHYFSQKYDCPCILINPSTSPSSALKKYIHTKNVDENTGEEIHITDAMLAEYAKREDRANRDINGYLINLFIAKDDAVIDYNKTLKSLPYRNFTCVKDTGGHDFNLHWDEVIKRAEELGK